MTSAIEAEIGVAETARLLGLSTRRVSALLSDGSIARAPSGKVTIASAVKGYASVLRGERAAKTVATTDLAFRAARSADLELRIEERSRRLIEAARAEAVSAVDELVGGLRVELFGVPSHLTQDLALRRRAEDLIDAALARTADRCRGEADRAPPSGRTPDTAEADQARRVGTREPRVRAKQRASGKT